MKIPKPIDPRSHNLRNTSHYKFTLNTSKKEVILVNHVNTEMKVYMLELWISLKSIFVKQIGLKISRIQIIH